MATATLVVAGSVSVLTGLAFALVGRAVALRSATGGRTLARGAHATWWLALGCYLVVHGGLTLAAGLDALDDGFYLATRAVLIPLLCAATWGITFYLVYLYTGRTRAATPLAVLYSAVAAAFFYATFAGRPAIVRGEWTLGLDDAAPLYTVVYALVGLPPILASAAYLLLLRRAHTVEQRYRILLVAGSIFAYVASGLAARYAHHDALIFVTLVVFGLGAALASLAAYYPPRRIRERLRAAASA